MVCAFALSDGIGRDKGIPAVFPLAFVDGRFDASLSPPRLDLAFMTLLEGGGGEGEGDGEGDVDGDEDLVLDFALGFPFVLDLVGSLWSNFTGDADLRIYRVSQRLVVFSSFFFSTEVNVSNSLVLGGDFLFRLDFLFDLLGFDRERERFLELDLS